mmetsp:Transcript_33290/g.77922  ORF Transcript_33290/g.77922 Transcript_33290/m.77922 type:complete len:236 (+) Transcript_33290:573-1280(+)
MGQWEGEDGAKAEPKCGEEEAGEDRREDEPHGVLGELVVHAVQQEVGGDGQPGELDFLVEVKHEPMQTILHQRPKREPPRPSRRRLEGGEPLLGGEEEHAAHGRQPDDGHDVPRSAGEELKEVPLEEACRLVQHQGVVDKLVVVCAEAAHLQHNGLAPVDILGEPTLHLGVEGRACPLGVSAGAGRVPVRVALLALHLADDVLMQDLLCAPAVAVVVLVVPHLPNVLPQVSQHDG